MSSRLSLSLQTIVDTFFPRYCAVCRRRLSIGERFLCVSCLLHLPLTRLKGRKNNLVERLLWDETVKTERANSLLYYEKSSDYRQVYFGFKYYNNPRLAVYCGELIANDLLDSDFFKDVDGLLPVPLARSRQRRRGYNQSEWLARGISRATGIPVISDAVERTVATESQTRLGLNERLTNVDHIFRVKRPQALAGRHLLLIDDVITTGSTMRTLARCVLTVEGVKVSVVSLAVSSYHRRQRFPENQRKAPQFADFDAENLP